MGALIILGAVGIAIFLWWLRILVRLLQDGPSTSREGWLASVVIVTVLGVLGAVIYLVIRPDRHVEQAPS
jgi:hypothetical protein